MKFIQSSEEVVNVIYYMMKFTGLGKIMILDDWY